jgi:DNA-binding LacI/PurR family transcriptional regulator
MHWHFQKSGEDFDLPFRPHSIKRVKGFAGISGNRFLIRVESDVEDLIAMTTQVPDPRKTRGSGKDILQVAKRAGVSPATVSRVTNGLSTVDKRLAKKVWQAIEELGYSPNPQARALVSGRSRVLGLLVSEITNPFFPELIQSFEDIAGENDFEVMVGSTNYNLERAKIFIRRLAQRRVEGVAVMTFRAESNLLNDLIAQDVPLVSVDVSIDAARSLVLEVDYSHGINQAVQHLAVLGHRCIGFASGPMPHLTNVRRKEAFLQSVKKIGLPPKAAPVFLGDHTFEGGTDAAFYFLRLRVRPTAIICSNDMMAVGVLRGLAERGIAVPSDMSVIGFDDIHLAEFANPPLTTIRMSRLDLAHAAFKGLKLMREGEKPGPFDSIRVETRLVVRQSTDAPREAASVLMNRPKLRNGAGVAVLEK